jgi:predicted AAA+ superfamily ATPase
VIDEVQRMPSLFEILRPICDDAKRKANFLLLGSASPQLVRGISESLAVPSLAMRAFTRISAS